MDAGVCDEYVVQLMKKCWDMMWDTLQYIINPFWSSINWMPGVFCQYVNFCNGVSLLVNDISTQNMMIELIKIVSPTEIF